MQLSEYTQNSIKFLDWEQQKAITSENVPLLLLAGPGSGKTTVLTHRIHYLSTQLKVPEAQILVLTFTKAAACQMRERYLKLSGSEQTKVTFGTFHSVFLRFLRQYSDPGEIRILDREELLEKINGILMNLCGESFTPGRIGEQVCDNIGKIKNGMRVEDDLTLRVYPLLKERMRAENCMDLDDILVLFYDLLIDSPKVLSMLHKRFHWILVDEFQDINRTQYEILRLLSGPESTVFAVGDDDQSIYGFRGSDPGYMKRFLKDFPRARKMLLPVNHRSTPPVVRASCRLIRHNHDRFGKNLKAAAWGKRKPVFAELPDEEAEADYISQEVTTLILAAKAAGQPFPTFAVLGRTRQSVENLKEIIAPVYRDNISFLTFHASKGLEFDCVFIVNASEGITPESRNLSGNALEEERRCFYVAMTRARHDLHILNTCTLYNKQMKKSRFITEIKRIL